MTARAIGAVLMFLISSTMLALGQGLRPFVDWYREYYRV
jgi:hypothetical protein